MKIQMVISINHTIVKSSLPVAAHISQSFSHYMKSYVITVISRDLIFILWAK